MTKPSFRVVLDAQNPHSHRIQVSITSITNHLPDLLMFPIWTPGSYLVREYSRHVTGFSGAKKINKNTWRVDSGKKSVSYEVYCYERTVRTSYLDGRVASLVGATLLPLLGASFEVHLLLPKDWKFAATALAHKKVKAGHWVFQVRDDDEWIDSPIVAAAPGFGGQATFRSKGKAHRLAWIGIEPAKPMREIVRDIQKIADQVQKMFGGAPFRTYDFLLDFYPKAYGGLEHRTSQLSQFDPFELSDPKKYENFLGLMSHEYFHAWNVKSLRPQALGPFNYFAENYTEDLWFAEGLTAYFDDKIVREAGLITPEAYNSVRLKDVSVLKDGNPGIQRRSVAEASFDAWIRYYRPDEDSPNSDVSYYIKGAQLAWCWDALLQSKTRKRWSLAKFMRAFWKVYGISADAPLATAKPGFTHEEIFEFAKRVTGVDHSIVKTWVHSRKPIPWRRAAAYFRVPHKLKIASASAHYLGCNFADREGKIFISNVYDGSSGETAGLAVHDEALALNGIRLSNVEGLQNLLKRHAKQKHIDFILVRSGKLYSAKVALRRHVGLGIDFE